MPAGKDLGGARRGTSTSKKNAFCSFCRKSYRDVGPLVEGPGDVYICGECKFSTKVPSGCIHGTQAFTFTVNIFQIIL